MKNDGNERHCVYKVNRVKTGQQFDRRENCDVASWWTGHYKLC